MPPAEPVVAWRLWRLCRDELVSWGHQYAWQRQPEPARCMEPTRRACPQAPGSGCKCGYWALKDPGACVRLAYSSSGVPPVTRPRGGGREPDPIVLGLTRLWGEIAIHGDEGYRAEHAAPLALFIDDPSRSPLTDLRLSPVGARTVQWLRDHRLARRPRPASADSLRLQRVGAAAMAYGVPALAIEDALSAGFLAEMNVPPAVLMRLQMVVNPLPSRRPRSGSNGPARAAATRDDARDTPSRSAGDPRDIGA